MEDFTTGQILFIIVGLIIFYFVGYFEGKEGDHEKE